MKVVVSRDVLNDAIGFVGRAAGNKSTQPVQSCIYMEAADGRLRLAASDLEFLHAEKAVEATVDEGGRAVVPVKLLQEAIRSLHGDEAEIETTDEGVALRSGTTQFVLRGPAADDFEMLPPPEDGVAVELEARELARAVDHVVYAALGDESRPILTGVLFSFTGDDLRLVATDTYRLAQYTIPEVASSQAEVLISRVFLKEAARQLSELDTVHFSTDGHLAEFRTESTVLRTRLIEGRYPNYEKVIPTEFAGKLLVNGEVLLDTLRRLYVIAREDAGRTVFEPTDEGLLLAAETPDLGKATEVIECDLQGEVPTIAFNARYLMEPLSVMGNDEVMLEFVNEYSAARLSKVTEDTFSYVLMPMQVLERRPV